MKMNLQHKIRVGLISSVIILACVGCAALGLEKAPSEEAKPSAGTEKEVKPSAREGDQPPDDRIYFLHTVRYQGESLSIIAGWYTGDIENWEELARVNPQINPNRIFPGDEISIPEDLMKTREPMPEEFVASFLPEPEPESKEEAVPGEPAPKPEEDEELDLIGPKEYPSK